MQIVCSNSVTCGAEAFSTLGEVQMVSESCLGPKDLDQADLLITRSKININRALVEGSPLKFYGTATAGTDHVDFDALADLGIHATSAPGCNARSVAEYVISALLELAVSTGYELKGKTLGLIGHGNAGTATGLLLEALGLTVLRNDPPKAQRDSQGYLSLDELLDQSDIVSLHVPLINDGPWPTRGLISHRALQRLKKGAVLINACRGEVLDTTATIQALDQGRLLAVVIDVWAPGIDRDLMDRAFLVSPHVAGHSYEGKINGTISLYKQACAFFGVAPSWDYTSGSSSIVGQLCGSAVSWQDILAVTRQAYAIRDDDQRFRKGLGLDEAGRLSLFKTLRSNYPLRHEFHRYELTCPPDDKAVFSRLGFKTV